MFSSTKKYGHEVGFSCAFRQWRAQSHCSFVHGYALAFRFVFEASELDDRNWVVDFGGLKTLKQSLESIFDHKTVIAVDDPYLNKFKELNEIGAIDLVILSDVGCEKFAELAFRLAEELIEKEGYAPRVRVVEVEVAEHGANSAIYKNE